MKRLVCILTILASCAAPQKNEVITQVEEIAPHIHEGTGLIQDEGLELVIGNCTPCHSAKLITQNRASREGWKSSIRWMQRTQKLWELGEKEALILDYLEKNYAPEETGRRKPLTDVEWYELED